MNPPASLEGNVRVMADKADFHVTAGALFDDEGRVLVAQRPAGSHMAGRWEFPGGKLKRGEQPLDGLRRELAEELGIELGAARPLIRLNHDYADRRVLLDVWRVTDYSGKPRGLDGQALDWVAPDALPDINLLAADRPITTALRLPEVARAVAGRQALEKAGSEDGPETLLWSPGPRDEADGAERDAVNAARARGHKVIVVGEAAAAAMIAAVTGADGILLAQYGEPLTVDPRGAFLVGVLCEDPAVAAEAAADGAHFVIVSRPRRQTARGAHFEDLCRRTGVPAYVGWYGNASPLEQLRALGAHGCAVSGPGSRPSGG